MKHFLKMVDKTQVCSIGSISILNWVPLPLGNHVSQIIIFKHNIHNFFCTCEIDFPTYDLPGFNVYARMVNMLDRSNYVLLVEHLLRWKFIVFVEHETEKKAKKIWIARLWHTFLLHLTLIYTNDICRLQDIP